MTTKIRQQATGNRQLGFKNLGILRLLRAPKPTKSINNDGDTLIEVIIAVVIIGTVLLSAYTLSTRAFKLGLSSRERAQAAQLVQTQAEALQALRNSNDWDDFASLIPPPGSEFHVFRNGANQWEISSGRLNNPVINGNTSIYSDIWITGNLTGPDPANPDKFEGTINIEWPRIGGGDEVSSVPLKLTDRNIPLANLTLDPAQAPEADFTGSPRSGIGSLTVNFQDLSTNNPTSWEWDFGDGRSSTAQNPTHTYNSAGSYTVKLTATGIGGSGTRTKRGYIRVFQNVNASFTGSPRSGDGPLTVRFRNLSTGDYNSCHWNFGDGSTSSTCSRSFTKRYTRFGRFTVTLTVSGPGGSDAQSRTSYITVREPQCGRIFGRDMRPYRSGHNHVSGTTRRFIHNQDWADARCRYLHRRIHIRLRADLFSGGPTMWVYRNGSLMYKRQINHSDYRVYSFNVGNTRRSDIRIVMTGDACQCPGADRNLQVHYVRFIR